MLTVLTALCLRGGLRGPRLVNIGGLSNRIWVGAGTGRYWWAPLTLQDWGALLNWWILVAPLYLIPTTGLGGSPRLVDIGGVPYLIPLADRTKLYNLTEMATLADLPGAFLLGAGAGSSRVAGGNCEVRLPCNVILLSWLCICSDDAKCSCAE